MNKIRTYANGIERFLHGRKGQRFFNFAYSIGAAIVIWGALFHILHLPGGSLLLCIGMGTEVLMFVLTAFDRPPREYAWEEVFPELDGEENPARQHTDSAIKDRTQPAGYAVATAVPTISDEAHKAAQNAIEELAERSREVTKNSADYADRMEDLARNVAALSGIYELQLKTLASQVDAIEQTSRGIKDMRDMYEKSAAQSAVFCVEAEKMAQNLRKLNSVYEKMLTAMTVNMNIPAPPAEKPSNPFE